MLPLKFPAQKQGRGGEEESMYKRKSQRLRKMLLFTKECHSGWIAKLSDFWFTFNLLLDSPWGKAWGYTDCVFILLTWWIAPCDPCDFCRRKNFWVCCIVRSDVICCVDGLRAQTRHQPLSLSQWGVTCLALGSPKDRNVVFSKDTMDLSVIEQQRICW